MIERLARVRIGTCALLVLGLVGAAHGGQLDTIEVGIIDFYGLRQVTAREARAALPFKEGDKLSQEAGRSTLQTEAEKRLSALPGVLAARTSVVCCDAGRAIVFVGLEQQGAALFRFREAPTGDVRLKGDVVQAGQDFMEALVAAVRAGDVAEDDSEGHALNRNPALRAVQERLLAYAARDLHDLRRVLRESSDPEQRALAAQVLGYAADKQAVVDDLTQAMSDPEPRVRNNAMRALSVFGAMKLRAGRPVPRISFQPFVALLNSPVWTDRNKASAALLELSRERDPQLLEALRKGALDALVEMARWKSKGHAVQAFLILGRIAGLSDEATMSSWERGDREAVISAATPTTVERRP